MAEERKSAQKEENKEQAAANRKQELERYAKEAGLVPISTIKQYLFPLEKDEPRENDLATLVLAHDAALEKEVLARATSAGDDAETPAERLSIRDALSQQVGKVVSNVMGLAHDMQTGRQQLRACFGAYGGKEQAAYQDNELRPFADRFRQVAEAIHQELIAMANRAG